MNKKKLIKNLAKEEFELGKKITKLNEFLSNRDNHIDLDPTQLSLLADQYNIMTDYRTILQQRINLIKD